MVRALLIITFTGKRYCLLFSKLKMSESSSGGARALPVLVSSHTKLRQQVISFSVHILDLSAQSL